MLRQQYPSAEYLSVRHAAVLVDASDKTVRRWLALANDPLPCVRIGNGRCSSIRIPRRELTAWLDRRRVEPDAKAIVDEIVARVIG